MGFTYKEGTFEFWVKFDENPNWLKDGIGRKFFDGPIGDAKIQVLKTPDMKFYIEHYHPISYIRTLSHDISWLDQEKDHHIAITWTPRELILYIDAEPVAKSINIVLEDKLILKDSFSSANTKIKDAGVTQLVEYNLAKVGVEGSNPFSRSKKKGGDE